MKNNSKKSGVLIVSLDFELFWGMQDVVTLDEYKEHLIGGRKAIPEVLEIFENNGIHATWAIVGFIFANSFNEAKKYFPKSHLFPSYENQKLTTYNCFNEINKYQNEIKCFFAPEIINIISKTEGQEIGCHTFSHYYTKAPGQTIEQFSADIMAARKIAFEKGFILSSIVLPRNNCNSDYMKLLKSMRFSSFRGREEDWIHKIKNKYIMKILRLIDVYFPLSGYGKRIPYKFGNIWNIVGSRMYKPYFKPLGWLERFKLMRIKREMEYAAKTGLVYHLWWHPHNLGIKTEYHLKCLKEIFQCYNELKSKYGMKSLNMKEAVEYLDKTF